MKVLFVTPFLRIPADFGAAIRSYELLNHLTKRHQVTVITYGEDETHQTDPWLVERGATIIRLPYALPWSSDKSRVMSLRNLLYYPPASYQRFSARSLSEAVTSCLKQVADIDLIVFDTELAGQCTLSAEFDKPHVMIVHDIYDVMLRRQFETMAWRPFKIIKLINWLKVSRYERRILARHQNLVAVSSADELFLKKHFPRAHVFLSPNGVDTDGFSRSGYHADSKTLLFVGGFEYEPNVDAFFYFCREILPLVRAECPDVQFIAAGRNPSSKMGEYAAAEDGITLTGTVPDVRPYYARASLVVVPLRVGGGIKLKTLEAFAMDVPVVSTSVGCEGIQAEANIHYTLADTAKEFAEGIITLLAKPGSARGMARRARVLVEKHYAWRSITNELESHLVEIARCDEGTDRSPRVTAATNWQ